MNEAFGLGLRGCVQQIEVEHSRGRGMNKSITEDRAAGPHITRVRHDVKRRSLAVESTLLLTPGMLRIVFRGDDLSDFVSLAPDDHVKVFLPTASGEEARRDYTPRYFDPSTRMLAIDFALHDAGPATRWARGAQPGARLEIGGPRGSAVVSPVVRHWLLIGDETALPAIGRRIEEAEAGVEITSIVATNGPEDEQRFETRSALTAMWVHRSLSAADDRGPLLTALRTLELKPETFVWIGAEAHVARAVRSCVVDEMGHDAAWMKAAGYWVAGKAGAHDKLE